jgi:hypothetical protein
MAQDHVSSLPLKGIAAESLIPVETSSSSSILQLGVSSSTAIPDMILDNDLQCFVTGCVSPHFPDKISLSDGAFGKMVYAECDFCSTFTVCDSQDDAHKLAFIYHEDCGSEEDNGGLFICLDCALKAYTQKMELNPEVIVGDSHYLCPSCEFDFGDIEELKRNA